MLRHPATALAATFLAALIGLAGCASADWSADDGRPVTADALRAAVTGNTLSGTFSIGYGMVGHLTVYYGADGVVKARVSVWAGPDEGTWDIEGDNKLCVKYRADRNGLRYCHTVTELNGDEMAYTSPESIRVSGKLLRGNPHGL